jgi:ribose transport system substrate-binding protein
MRIGSALVFLAACLPGIVTASSSARADNPPKPEIHIALVMKTLTNPFFVAMEKGARRAAQELGVTLVVKTAARETSATQQIAIIDKLVREDAVKAIVIAPADSIGVIPALKRARDKGIFVINIDNALDPAFSQKAGLAGVPIISVDNRKSAYLSAKVIADQITTPSEAAILEGIPEAENAAERKAGAVQAFGENPKITLVATETAHWQVDEAHEVARKIFAQHPHVALIFCANDMMALGVIQYLQEINRPDVKVAGFDAIDEARAAIKSGRLAASIDQQPGEQGYLGIKYAYRAIAGESLPPATVLDGLVVTK